MAIYNKNGILEKTLNGAVNLYNALVTIGNMSLKPTSILRKNYYNIYSVLNKNIGDIDYQQTITSTYATDGGVSVGDVVSIDGERTKGLFNFLTNTRLKYSNYFDYAQENLNSFIGYSAFSRGQNMLTINNDIISLNEEVYNNPNDDGDLDNVLTYTSYNYLSMVDLLRKSKLKIDSSFTYRFGKQGNEVIPHQLSSYNMLNYNLSPNLSIVNQKSINDTIIYNWNLGTNLNFDKDKTSFTSTTYYKVDNKVKNNIESQLKAIKGVYGVLIEENKSIKKVIGTNKNDIDAYFDGISNAFNSSAIYNEIRTYAENTTFNAKDPSLNETKTNEIKSFNATKSLTNYNDLLDITNQNFNRGRYKTMIAKFGSYAQSDIDIQTSEYEQYHTAVSNRGTSHGRNLLRSENERDVNYTEGSSYTDPYCRVWTNYHQYHRYQDLIRPFTTINQNGTFADVLTYDNMYEKDGMGMKYVRTKSRDGFGNGCKRLGEYGVLNSETNLVNITPTQNEFDVDGKKKAKLKQCMFSIENLAWKDFTKGNLSEEQKGPIGGRIMWFPPYDLKFNESTSVNWNPTEFIGRGEKIYTYTNSERTGTLSFKLLIDHPSIINYVQEKTDNDFNQTGTEYDLLRFFAGCKSLNVKNLPPNTNKTDSIKNKEEQSNSKKPTEEKAKEKPANRVSTDEIVFLVYYPNNYTGQYEDNDFDPITYLMNGIGTQKMLEDNVIVDIPTDDTVVGYGESQELFGYEIKKNDKNGITPSGLTSSENANKYQIRFEYDGLTLMPQQNTNISPKFDWWYRVDKRPCLDENGKYNPKYSIGKDNPNKCLECEILSSVSGHKDLQSCGLNSSLGYDKIVENASFYNITDEQKANVFAFTEVYVAMHDIFLGKTVLSEKLKTEYCDSTRLNILIEKIKRIKDKKLMATLITQGFASTHGYPESNKTLGMDRAKTIQKWLTTKMDFTSAQVLDSKTITTSADEGGKKDESEFKAKRGRCAKAVISIIEEETVPLQETTSSANDATQVKKADPREVRYTNDKGGDLKNIFYDQTNSYYADGEIETVWDEATHSYIRMAPEASVTFVASKPKIEEVIDTSDPTARDRYDNEYEFFSKLTKDELSHSFIRKKITEKIKYFDPAFHSISPEGFNARLTFLQQCTRQGPTIGRSELNGHNTANNLAFGRQPVCVLRVGDFYYTKIIITSLQIDYDTEGIKWDLNPEGIGVQPMFANINISFTFLGGSDLAGPIGRLQNALSFNYYANTSVYDDRAEMIQYREDGKPNKYHANKNM